MLIVLARFFLKIPIEFAQREREREREREIPLCVMVSIGNFPKYKIVDSFFNGKRLEVYLEQACLGYIHLPYLDLQKCKSP